MLLLLRKLIPLFAVAAAGCGGMRTIQVDQYGGMREALMLGQTQGRVTLLDVTAKARCLWCRLAGGSRR